MIVQIIWEQEILILKQLSSLIFFLETVILDLLITTFLLLYLSVNGCLLLLFFTWMESGIICTVSDLVAFETLSSLHVLLPFFLIKVIHLHRIRVVEELVGIGPELVFVLGLVVSPNGLIGLIAVIELDT